MTVRQVLLILAVICFAIGAIAGETVPMNRLNWTNAGLAFAAASLLA